MAKHFDMSIKQLAGIEGGMGFASEIVSTLTVRQAGTKTESLNVSV